VQYEEALAVQRRVVLGAHPDLLNTSVSLLVHTLAFVQSHRKTLLLGCSRWRLSFGGSVLSATTFLALLVYSVVASVVVFVVRYAH
jgi:hypothetical protein